MIQLLVSATPRIGPRIRAADADWLTPRISLVGWRPCARPRQQVECQRGEADHRRMSGPHRARHHDPKGPSKTAFAKSMLVATTVTAPGLPYAARHENNADGHEGDFIETFSQTPIKSPCVSIRTNRYGRQKAVPFHKIEPVRAIETTSSKRQNLKARKNVRMTGPSGLEPNLSSPRKNR